jgi:hypothetical protein
MTTGMSEQELNLQGNKPGETLTKRVGKKGVEWGAVIVATMASVAAYNGEFSTAPVVKDSLADSFSNLSGSIESLAGQYIPALAAISDSMGSLVEYQRQSLQFSKEMKDDVQRFNKEASISSFGATVPESKYRECQESLVVAQRELDIALVKSSPKPYTGIIVRVHDPQAVIDGTSGCDYCKQHYSDVMKFGRNWTIGKSKVYHFWLVKSRHADDPEPIFQVVVNGVVGRTIAGYDGDLYRLLALHPRLSNKSKQGVKR